MYTSLQQHKALSPNRLRLGRGANNAAAMPSLDCSNYHSWHLLIVFIGANNFA